ncbi:MAG: S8 family peptidase [Lachnospiraceae bacterium]
MKKQIQAVIPMVMIIVLFLSCRIFSTDKITVINRYDGFTNDEEISKANYPANINKFSRFFVMNLAGPGLTAWDYATGKNVNVAVFDGGIDLNDTELNGRIKECYNASLMKEGAEYITNKNHGTFVAKILAGAGNNKYANAGVAYNSNLYFVQVDTEGTQESFSKSVIEGIKYAVEKNCRIICMSISDYVYDEEMEAAINAVYYRSKNSILFFGSAGNSGKEEYRYPSSYKNVMCISGASYSSKTDTYSSLAKGTYHDHMDLAAPGGSTSAATPYAAGTAALILEEDPSLSARECEAILKKTAKDIGASGYDKKSGYGLVQPLTAVQYAKYKTDSITRLIEGTSSYKKTVGSKSFKLNAKTSGSGVLSYKSRNKKVCTVSSSGKVTVKGIGKTTIKVSVPKSGIFSKASKEISITIKPKATTIKSAKKTAKKQITVNWKKDSKVTGYQIQVSADKDFKNVEKYSAKVSVTSKKISVGKKKTYYVRMRSYKKINGKRLYSGYSKVKKVKM